MRALLPLRLVQFRLVICLLATSFLIAMPMTALAQKKDDISYQDRREAKRLFNQGHLAYRRGDYEESILKWQESFALSKEPLINMSMANAYERLGKLNAALKHLQAWRAKSPRREHKELDSRIESLQSRVARQDSEENKKKEADEKRGREEEAQRKKLEAQNKRDAGGGGGGGADDTTEPDEGPAAVDIVGFSLVGLGGAAVIAGVVMDIIAHTSRPDEAAACTDTNETLLCRESSRSDIENSNTLAIAGDITWIAGAAIAASGIGVVLFLSSYKIIADDDGADSAEQGGALLLPYAHPQGAGLTLHGSF
jgi:tetratricopeptide (TPR) repeat protein